MESSTPTVSMSTPIKEKRITVHFLPSIGVPADVITGVDKIGSRVDASDAGFPIGYRVWTGTHTFLYPAGNVLKLELDF